MSELIGGYCFFLCIAIIIYKFLLENNQEDFRNTKTFTRSHSFLFVDVDKHVTLVIKKQKSHSS